MSEKKNDATEVAAVYPIASDKALALVLQDGQPQEVMMLTQASEGKPIHGPMVFLEERQDGLYNLSRSNHGPAQVATKQYRNNYDKIFNKNLN
jgi:hypothetical protein